MYISVDPQHWEVIYPLPIMSLMMDMQQSQLPVSPRHFMVDVNPKLISVTSVLFEILILYTPVLS